MAGAAPIRILSGRSEHLAATTQPIPATVHTVWRNNHREEGGALNQEQKMKVKTVVVMAGLVVLSGTAFAQNCPYDPRCLDNPYGAGSPYQADGLNNPHSQYGSRYSNKSHTNPYATDAPKLYDGQGNYRGRLSSNPYDPDSTSNPNGRYGSRHSPDSINNPYGAGNPYNNKPLYVVPSR